MPEESNTPNYHKILFIEDEPFISELYSRQLKKAGYEATIVADGLEGLKQAQTNAYDIILLDIMVPNLTGTELLAKLRESTPDLKAKIIVTTNLEQNEKARQAVEKQADGYLIKANITPRELVEFLRSLE